MEAWINKASLRIITGFSIKQRPGTRGSSRLMDASQAPPAAFRTSISDNSTKVHYHYPHTDDCNALRWTARESYQFMYSRPWHEVVDIYSNMVNGRVSLLDLIGNQTCIAHGDKKSDHEIPDNEDGATKSGRWERLTFKIVLSYHGDSFDGWQRQPGLNTVQGLVENSLGSFIDERKAELLATQGKPLEGCAVVAGRTDKGVSALGQVCSFYTWKKDVHPNDIEDAINKINAGKIRVISVSKVSRVFHPNFSAKWRRYLYIFPLNSGENRDDGTSVAEDICEEKLCSSTKPKTFSVVKVNQLLQKLEGKLLSYKLFARDTKASRNEGPPTECFVHHARAKQIESPNMKKSHGRNIMFVELVANRFLRKMVRVLVATAVREAAAGAQDDALLKLMEATCRRATAPPAPPDGLCLVDVGYTDFDHQICLLDNLH